MPMSSRLFFSIPAFALLLLFAAPVYAQYILPPSADPILFKLSPSNPEPGSIVHIFANSLTFDLKKTHVTWYVNDALLLEGDGLTEVDVTLGSTGSATHVIALAEKDGETLASAEVFMRPAEVDLLWEANSYVPPFYKGKHLASPNSVVRAEAYARLRDQEGNLILPSEIEYTWHRNGALLASQSGRGKSYASFPAPLLFGSDTISVEVTSIDESVSASATTIIPSVDPFVVLYQEHPLFGIFYHAAVARAAFLPDVEATFVAIPYFASSITSHSDARLLYAWRVNDRPITVDGAEPHRLTINAENSTGEAHVEVAVSHLTNYFMDARGAWDIAFDRIPGGDPFSTNGL